MTTAAVSHGVERAPGVAMKQCERLLTCCGGRLHGFGHTPGSAFVPARRDHLSLAFFLLFVFLPPALGQGITAGKSQPRAVPAAPAKKSAPAQAAAATAAPAGNWQKSFDDAAKAYEQGRCADAEKLLQAATRPPIAQDKRAAVTLTLLGKAPPFSARSCSPRRAPNTPIC
jgi:hypothetical protein